MRNLEGRVKFRIELAVIILFVVSPAIAFEKNSEKWTNVMPLEARAQTPAEKISEKDYIEVSASKRETAESRLLNAASVGLNERELKFYGQGAFQCSLTKQPYLIRAVYSNGGTGSYMVKRFGPNILVIHGSLGPSGEVHRSALIACLDFEPVAVFGQIEGAM